MRTRRGQALMELAVGMFTLALLLSAIFVFVRYIARSLEIENHLRASWRILQQTMQHLETFS